MAPVSGGLKHENLEEISINSCKPGTVERDGVLVKGGTFFPISLLQREHFESTSKNQQTFNNGRIQVKVSINSAISSYFIHGIFIAK